MKKSMENLGAVADEIVKDFAEEGADATSAVRAMVDDMLALYGEKLNKEDVLLSSFTHSAVLAEKLGWGRLVSVAWSDDPGVKGRINTWGLGSDEATLELLEGVCEMLRQKVGETTKQETLQ